MTRRADEMNSILQELAERLARLEHEAELFRTVLIVKEPTTVHAANAFDGLRKQVVAAAAERRSHLAQLAAMAIALRRATSLEDLVPQVQEWMSQAGVTELSAVPRGSEPQDLFEDVAGSGLAGAAELEVVEPAYVDVNTGAVLRLGRAQRSTPTPPPLVVDRPVHEADDTLEVVAEQDDPVADDHPVADDETIAEEQA